MTIPPLPPLAAPPDPATRAPKFPMPALACDTHAHVFGPVSQYALIPNAIYSPSVTLGDEHRRMLDAARLTRGVLVQPSIYGTNNDCLLTELDRDPDRLRGVAVIPLDTGTSELEALHARGVRGIRVNIADARNSSGEIPLEPLKALARRMKPLNWHVEFLLHVNEVPQLDRLLADFPVDCSFGHLGHVPFALGTRDPGFQALLRLMRDGKAWVKLSAPYRLTMEEAPYPAVSDFAQLLLDAAPERLLWGSDWPHVRVKTSMPNVGTLLDVFGDWVPDPAVRQRILVDNAAVLYDFPTPRQQIGNA